MKIEECWEVILNRKTKRQRTELITSETETTY